MQYASRGIEPKNRQTTPIDSVAASAAASASPASTVGSGALAQKLVVETVVSSSSSVPASPDGGIDYARKATAIFMSASFVGGSSSTTETQSAVQAPQPTISEPGRKLNVYV